MLKYGQFCPVSLAAEIFADRWSPLILRELCFGASTFGDLLSAMPFISRTMLAQRLKELASAEVVAIEPKARGRGHLYRLTEAGADFRPLIELLSIWGQRWIQGRVGPDNLDPGLLMYGMSRQIDPGEIPDGRTVAVSSSAAFPNAAEAGAIGGTSSSNLRLMYVSRTLASMCTLSSVRTLPHSRDSRSVMSACKTPSENVTSPFREVSRPLLFSVD